MMALRLVAAYAAVTPEDWVCTDPADVLALAYGTRMAPATAGIGTALIDVLVDGHPAVIRAGWKDAYLVGQAIADAGGIPVIVNVPRWAIETP